MAASKEHDVTQLISFTLNEVDPLGDPPARSDGKATPREAGSDISRESVSRNASAVQRSRAHRPFRADRSQPDAGCQSGDDDD